MEWDHTLFIGHPTRFQLQPRALQYHGAPLGGARGLCPASCHQEDRDPTGSGMEKQKQDPRWLNEHRGLHYSSLWETRAFRFDHQGEKVWGQVI